MKERKGIMTNSVTWLSSCPRDFPVQNSPWVDTWWTDYGDSGMDGV